MPTDFTFTLSVSEQRFRGKPSKSETSRITFRPRQLTTSTLLDYACDGRVFCPNFKSTNPNGEFHISAKTAANYDSTSVIFFDLDNMTIPMREFIFNLPFKPSFGYTSYSNGLAGKGNRFRLGYVFNHPIKGSQEFRAVYFAIANANNFPKKGSEVGELDTRLETQCYFGTRSDADVYHSRMVYAADEFDEYRASVSIPYYQTSTPTILSNSPVTVDESFLNDFNTLGTADFLKKYFDQYHRNYLASLSSPLILDKSQMFYTYPDDYVTVYRLWKGKRTLKWDIGSNRKSRLFVTAQIMLHNVPTLTVENLLYNLRLERDWYYVNTDGKVNNRYLVQTCCRSMVKRSPLHPSSHKAFAVNKRFWKEQGVSAQAASNHIRAYLRTQRIRELINPYVSVEQNFEVLKENGVKICLKTLKRMVTRGDIQIYKTRSLPTVLSECRKDVTNPVTNEILNLIKADGTIKQSTIAEMFELDIRTVKRYFKDMNGTLIRREGNNRNGRWVVIEPSGEDSQK